MFPFLLQCLTQDVALSVLEDDGKAYLNEDEYQRISTVLLYYIINLQDLCVSNAASSSSPSSSSSFGNYQFYLLALTNLHPGEDSRFLSSSETESILQLINQHYQPSNQDTSPDLQVRIFYERSVLSRQLHIRIWSFHIWSHSVLMLLASLKMLKCKKIQVLACLQCPNWPQPSSPISCRATVSDGGTSHLLLSLLTISFNP